MLSNDEKRFLLQPKALPTTVHYQNIRNLIPRAAWDKIRKHVYEEANHVCELCGAKKRLEAHEIWNFDFKSKTQTLQNIVALCANCHRIQHANLLKLHSDKGIVNIDLVVKHFNNISNQKITTSEFLSRAQTFCAKYENIEWELKLKL